VTQTSRRIRGFDDPLRYERTRPGYPTSAVDWLCTRSGMARGAVVADVGAGTGRLTTQLHDRGYAVLAVEPNEHMARILAQRCPQIPTFNATAECLPIATGSVDLITVAQAFHLLDVGRAASEFHRVLMPRRALCLLWNRRVQDALHDQISELTEPLRGDVPALRTEAWKPELARTGLFDGPEQMRFEHHQLLSRRGLIERTVSTPYVVASSPAAREELTKRVTDLVSGLAEPIRLDYYLEVYVFHATGWRDGHDRETAR
jgi:SAM-dependent methyltransferase